MITYMIVENDEYELPVKCGLKTSKEVGEWYLKNKAKGEQENVSI